MEQQVLTIEQMKELEALGIDTSNASMCWYPDNDPDFPNPIYMLTYIENIGAGYKGRIPTFTLQNLLDLIPEHLPVKSSQNFEYSLDICPARDKAFWNIMYIDYYDVDNPNLKLVGIDCYKDKVIRNESLLIAAFEMVKWLKEENFI